MEVRVAVFTIATVFVANLREVVGPPGVPWDTALSWGMAAFQKSDTGNALSQTLTSLKEMPDQLYSGTQQLVSSIDAATNAWLGECDGPALVEIIKPKLKLNSVPKTKCLRGYKVTFDGNDVTSETANLQINKDDLKIEGFSPEEEEEGDSQTLFISFTFSDLYFSSVFVSKPQGFSVGRTRKGRTRFRLIGPNSLILRVRVPKDLAKVKSESTKDKCFVRIREVIFQLGKTVVVKDLWYDSLSQNTANVGLTKNVIKDMVKIQAVRDGLIENIKTSLKKVLEPVIRNEKVFCDSKKVAVAEAPKCTAADILVIEPILKV